MIYCVNLIMLKITENPDTQTLSSLKIAGGKVKMFVEIESLEDFQEFIKKFETNFYGENFKIMCVGDGTNTIFVNENDNLILLKLNLKELTPIQPSPVGKALVQAEAGVNWDEFVQKYIELGGSELESLSIIPGTVGASPVQNIGAYGQEVSNFIKSVKVYDLGKKEFRELKNSECNFSYRDSLFKQEKNRFIILSVIFEIKKLENPNQKIKIPNYKDLLNYFNLQGKVSDTSDLWKSAAENSSDILTTVPEIRQAIISIRNLKFPNVAEVPNCGSFFKNPIILETDLKKVKEFFPEIPIYKTPDPKFVKLPAGYILERLGYKNFNPDFTKGNFGFYKNHSLILISNGKGSVSEFLEFVKNIKQKVLETCGINLEEEVNLI